MLGSATMPKESHHDNCLRIELQWLDERQARERKKLISEAIDRVLAEHPFIASLRDAKKAEEK